jgi:hypothetical protein
MYIAERNELVYENGIVEDSLLETPWNNVWLNFVTSSTVGYGEIYPMTHLGRLMILIISIFGSFFLGMFVIALTSSLDHDIQENESYIVLIKAK